MQKKTTSGRKAMPDEGAAAPRAAAELPLRLGVLDLVPQADRVTSEQALAEAVSLAQTAEACGYARYWAAEHHDLPGLACASPEILLAHIGALTKSIRLGTGALLLPHYSPLKVAETFHLLAALYPGRIELGIGRAPGGPAQASMALSGNFLQRVYGMEQSVQALIQLLEGTYVYEGQPVKANPEPRVKPGLWMLGTGSKSAIYAAQSGCGFVFGAFMSDEDPERVIASYREAFVPSARLDKPEVIMAVSVLCAETREEAEDLVRESEAMTQARGHSMPPRKHQIYGTPQEVTERLKHWQDAYGNEEFLLLFPTRNYAARRRSCRLLAEHVHSLAKV
jgi:luciferase family oxidoreductase group 1